MPNLEEIFKYFMLTIVCVTLVCLLSMFVSYILIAIYY